MQNNIIKNSDEWFVRVQGKVGNAIRATSITGIEPVSHRNAHFQLCHIHK